MLITDIPHRYDAIIYARIYGARRPGTHQLCYVEEADHNFTGVCHQLYPTSTDAYPALSYRMTWLLPSWNGLAC